MNDLSNSFPERSHLFPKTQNLLHYQFFSMKYKIKMKRFIYL